MDLAVTHKQRLEQHELIIEQGLKSFVEVGQALMEIRDDKLYIDADNTFEAYCDRRWNFTRGRAYQLIDAATVVKAVSTIVDIAPANEAQARVLTKLPTEKLQNKVWEKAVETAPKNDAGKPQITAAHVQAVADKISPPKPKKTRKAKAAKPATDDGPRRKNGKIIGNVWLDWEEVHGKLTRATDNIAEKHPADKFCRDVQGALTTAFNLIADWKKAVR